MMKFTSSLFKIPGITNFMVWVYKRNSEFLINSLSYFIGHNPDLMNKKEHTHQIGRKLKHCCHGSLYM